MKTGKLHDGDILQVEKDNNKFIARFFSTSDLFKPYMTIRREPEPNDTESTMFERIRYEIFKIDSVLIKNRFNVFYHVLATGKKPHK